MIILIAESKTMCANELPVSNECFEEHKPVGEAIADEVMHLISEMSVNDIAHIVKVSPKMASGIARMAYEFPEKRMGLEAIRAYTGVVFRAFDYDSLAPSDKIYTTNTLRIVSSLYGWLRPDDMIKAYRTDFTTHLAPGGKAFAEYWRKDVTIELVRELQRARESDILNLLPGDAAKCVDWKLVKRYAKVWKVDFKELKDGGGYRTPHSGKLKALRGELLRTIIINRIMTPTLLLDLKTDNMLPLGTPDYPDHIAFCV